VATKAIVISQMTQPPFNKFHCGNLIFYKF
jgi:hypothetical protein